jgi:hypothetical protein
MKTQSLRTGCLSPEPEDWLSSADGWGSWIEADTTAWREKGLCNVQEMSDVTPTPFFLENLALAVTATPLLIGALGGEGTLGDGFPDCADIINPDPRFQNAMELSHSEGWKQRNKINFVPREQWNIVFGRYLL